MSNVTTAIEAMAEPIGFDIAFANDQAQAALLNGLARGFASSMPAGADAERQVSYLTAKLTNQAVDFLIELGESAKYEKESRTKK